MAWGIVGLCLLLAVELTSLALTHLPRLLWRRVHYAGFALFVTTTAHALGAGTDSRSPAFLLAVVAVCALVAVLTAARGAVLAPPPRPPAGARRRGLHGATCSPARPGRRHPPTVSSARSSTSEQNRPSSSLIAHLQPGRARHGVRRHEVGKPLAASQRANCSGVRTPSRSTAL